MMPTILGPLVLFFAVMVAGCIHLVLHVSDRLIYGDETRIPLSNRIRALVTSLSIGVISAAAFLLVAFVYLRMEIP